MLIRLDRTTDLSADDRASIRALSQAVYPPEAVKDWPGRHIEWAKPGWCVRVHADGTLVSHVGVVIRDGTHDGLPRRIGGIGGVMTHPAARRKGYADAGIKRAIEFFCEEAADFGLLVCEDRLREYYGRQGWRDFGGELLVRQRGERTAFVFNRVMTLAVRVDAPISGTIDLCGPPW